MSVLTAQDRCDKCGAQAYVITLHPISNGPVEMYWCNHHYEEHKTHLAALLVHDERELLKTKV